MGGNSRHRRSSSSSNNSSFSIFNIFKGRSKTSRRSSSEVEDSNGRGGKVWWPSDDDKGRYWVAEPGIDRKAEAYIDKIHQIRFSETERQTVMVHPN